MAEPERDIIPVKISKTGTEISVDLNPDDLIDLRGDDSIETVNITLAGTRIAQLQRFEGLPPGVNPADFN